jgi:hypothetical protein
MNIKFLSLGLLAVSMMGGLQGCASEALSEADAEEQSSTEADLTANAAKLVGSFEFEAGALPPRFNTLKFNADGTYFADIDTGIRCVAAPCPAGAQSYGRYSATATYLTLRAEPGSDKAFSGRYKYALAIGRETVTMWALQARGATPSTKSPTYGRRTLRSLLQRRAVAASGLLPPLARTVVWVQQSTPSMSQRAHLPGNAAHGPMQARRCEVKQARALFRMRT